MKFTRPHLPMLLLLCCWTTSLGAATLTVTTTNDSGPGSLREAIMIANGTGGRDTITFNIPGPGPHVIRPQSGLPTISDPVRLDATTQTGYVGRPLIELNGGALNGDTGFSIQTSNSVVAGLALTRFDIALLIAGTQSFSNWIYGNYIGLDITGTNIAANGEGIDLAGGAHHNLIGTDGNGTNDVAERNVISGNDYGLVFFDAHTNRIAGNFIGTDRTGTAARGNRDAFYIESSAGNIIGTDSSNDPFNAAERNVISGNNDRGIILDGANRVSGNFIGTDLTGAFALPNQYGLQVSGVSSLIGSDGDGLRDAEERNVISGNNIAAMIVRGSGTRNAVIRGNYIGTDAGGTAAVPNGNGIDLFAHPTNTMVFGNVISGNLFHGIVMDNGPSLTRVEGNLIGLDVTGTNALGNAGNGVFILNAPRNIIGASNGPPRNVISGNQGNGIYMAGAGATGNAVWGNYIGLNSSGLSPVPNGSHGVHLDNAPNNFVGATAGTARNVISGNTFYGVYVAGSGSTNNVIQRNYIGLNPAGTSAVGNQQFGVYISGAPRNLLGGNSAALRNVISGNLFDGVFIGNPGASGNRVEGNYIGTDLNGAAAVGNGGNGIDLVRAAGNFIGTSTPAGTNPPVINLISGNGNAGVRLEQPGTSSNWIQNNWIGVDVSGTNALPNLQDGIFIFGGADNRVGGETPNRRNVIAGNAHNGIWLATPSPGTTIQGNYIGLGANGTTVRGNGQDGILCSAPQALIGGLNPGAANRIVGNAGHGVEISFLGATNVSVLGNQIRASGGLGIQLGMDGVTTNDLADVDEGPNRFQNFPVLTLAYTTGAGTVVQGTLNSTPLTMFRLEFFANANIDPSGFGEGETFLGYATVMTDASGNAGFALQLPTLVPGANFVTATATDANGNTSEFSRAAPLNLLPIITSQPQSQNVARSNTATFSVGVSCPPVTFQWRFNGVAIPAATADTLVIPNAQTNNAGSYQVLLSSSAGVVTSAVATLSVLIPPAIVSQPMNTNVAVGGTINLCVGATGSGPLRYQWRKNGVNIPGATNICLTISNAQIANSGSYSVVVANLLDAINSQSATVLVGVTMAAVADNFASRIVIAGTNGSRAGTNNNATRQIGEPLHAGKPGSNSVWFTWAAPTNGVATFQTTGSTFDTLLAIYTGTNLTTLTNVVSDDDSGGFATSLARFNAVAGRSYAIAVDGFAGARGVFLLSWNLEATAQTAPVISTQPLSQTVQRGGMASFSVVASGGTLVYRWFFNGNSIPGATSSNLLITSVAISNVGFYSVRITNNFGRSVTSLPAALEIGPISGAVSQDKLEDLPEGGGSLLGLAERFQMAGSGGSVINVSAGSLDAQIFSTTNSTTQGLETNHCGVIGGSSRWFQLQPAATATMVIDTRGSTFDTVLSVMTGSSIFDLKLVTCNNDEAPPALRSSRVRFRATNAVIYKLAVDGANAASGQAFLNWGLGFAPTSSIAPPLNVFGETRAPLMLQAPTNGTPAPTYQWFFNDVAIPNETNGTFWISQLAPGNAGRYTVLTSNFIGTATSVVAIVTVQTLFDHRAFVTYVNQLPEFRMTGWVNAPFVLDTSLTFPLVSWQPVLTNQSPGSYFGYTNNQVLGQPYRYYRVRPFP